MADVYSPLQMADNKGNPLGRWRMMQYSDEASNTFIFPMCSCRNGHESAEQAYCCPEWLEKKAELFL